MNEYPERGVGYLLSAHHLAVTVASLAILAVIIMIVLWTASAIIGKIEQAVEQDQ